MSRKRRKEGCTPKQERFIYLYILTGNAVQSYIEAYKPKRMTNRNICTEAHKLLNNPHITPILERERNKMLHKFENARDRIISTLISILEARPSNVVYDGEVLKFKPFEEWGIDELVALRKFKTDSKGEITSIEFYDKIKAAHALCVMMGLYETEKIIKPDNNVNDFNVQIIQW